MGDVGKTLLGIGKALGGAAIPGTFARQAAGGMLQSGLIDPMGMVGPGLNPGEAMFGMNKPFAEMLGLPGKGESQLGNVDPRVIMDESGAMGGNQGEEIVATGDGWNPRKPTILGAIADAFLMSRGGKPMFGMMRDRRNLNEAMSGYVDDPVGAMKRLSQIPGQEENVAKLMGQYRDDQRADLAAEGLNDTRRSRFYKQIGGLLNTVKNSKDPIAAYRSSLPILRKLSEKAGDEDMMWGDEYDPQAVENYIGMNIEPDDQIKMEALRQHRDATRDLNERKFENQADYRERRLEQIDTAETGRNTRAASKPNAKSAVGGGFVRDPNGNVVGQVSKSGRVAVLAAPDGGKQYFEVLPNGKLGRRIPDALVPKDK